MFARQRSDAWILQSIPGVYLLAIGLLSPSVYGAAADSAKFFVENYGLADRNERLVGRAIAGATVTDAAYRPNAVVR